LWTSLGFSNSNDSYPLILGVNNVLDCGKNTGATLTAPNYIIYSLEAKNPFSH